MEDFTLDYFETDLEDGEMILEIQVPPMPRSTAARYEKFNIIKNDQGTVNCAVALTLDEDGTTCTDARIVIGAAGPAPMRIPAAEQLLIGEGLNDALLQEIGHTVSESVEPVSDIHGTEEYRRRLAAALSKKNIKRSWNEAQHAA
jgi:CO/xanthine dehydrogenase FAD-binding subunit